MKLIQILMPLYDNKGSKFPKETFSAIKIKLTQKYKGMTAYSQAPAEGLWDDGKTVQKDHIILYEVMTEDFDKNWWKGFADHLEKELKQQKIMIRWFEISII